jgi:hypothetical protein
VTTIFEFMELHPHCPQCNKPLTPRVIIGSDEVVGSCDSCMVSMNPNDGTVVPSHVVSGYNLHKLLEIEKELRT